ncbi:hypothetical protein V8C43DRAFT_292127, partial [Trichoderma afarasin]
SASMLQRLGWKGTGFPLSCTVLLFIKSIFGACRNGAAPVTDKLLKIGGIAHHELEKANKYLPWLCADIVDTEKQML